MIRRRAPRLAAGALVIAWALAGCAPTPAPETAWRDLVQQAASQASTGDYAGSDATLLTVEDDVTAARDEGRIDAARADAILAAAAGVRAELAALTAPAPSPEPAPVETPATETPAPETPVTDESSDDESDDTGETGVGNSGNGNAGNNGKGNNGNGDKKNKDDE